MRHRPTHDVMVERSRHLAGCIIRRDSPTVSYTSFITRLTAPTTGSTTGLTLPSLIPASEMYRLKTGALAEDVPERHTLAVSYHSLFPTLVFVNPYIYMMCL